MAKKSIRVAVPADFLGRAKIGDRVRLEYYYHSDTNSNDGSISLNPDLQNLRSAKLYFGGRNSVSATATFKPVNERNAPLLSGFFEGSITLVEQSHNPANEKMEVYGDFTFNG